jgi:hypothetical protein
MKINVNQDNTIQLEEVFNPIVLKTFSGEELTISMRDSGFEFTYGGNQYSAQKGIIDNFNSKSEERKALEEEIIRRFPPKTKFVSLFGAEDIVNKDFRFFIKNDCAFVFGKEDFRFIYDKGKWANILKENE